MYSHFSMSLHGLVTVRCYKREEQFLDKFKSLLNDNGKIANYYFNIAKLMSTMIEWLSWMYGIIGLLSII